MATISSRLHLRVPAAPIYAGETQSACHTTCHCALPAPLCRIGTGRPAGSPSRLRAARGPTQAPSQRWRPSSVGFTPSRSSLECLDTTRACSVSCTRPRIQRASATVGITRSSRQWQRRARPSLRWSQSHRIGCTRLDREISSTTAILSTFSVRRDRSLCLSLYIFVPCSISLSLSLSLSAFVTRRDDYMYCKS